jgi:branched-chain amino acid aminotransferase
MMIVSAWKFVPPGGKDYLLEPVHFKSPPESLNAAANGLPEGVFTTFRTYSGSKAFLLDSHFNRLEKSAALLGHSINLGRKALRLALIQALEEFGSGDARVRLMVDLQAQVGSVYILLEPLILPSLTDYQNGVHVVTFRQQREKPEAKQTSFIPVSERLRSYFPPRAFEGLLVDKEGCIREGFSSNFYAVKNQELWTAGEGILSGLSRLILMEAAALLKIPFNLGCIPIDEVASLEEAFLTSSTRAVLPIRQIDGTIIGEGKPGFHTQKLSESYWKLLIERLEEI